MCTNIKRYLSAHKKSIQLLLMRRISLAHYFYNWHRIYNLSKMGVSTSSYLNNSFDYLSDEEFEAKLKEFKVKWFAEERRKQWKELYFADKRFFQEFADFKYECSQKLVDKRQKEYQKRYHIPNDGYVGPNVIFRCSHFIENFEPKLQIGHHTCLTENVFIDWTGQVFIGDNVCITNGVVIESHIQDLKEFARTGESVNTPTTLHIGNNVYIGSRAVILGSCTEIGDNSVIAANAVVTKDVPANCLVAGVPAKVIRICEYNDKRNNCMDTRNVEMFGGGANNHLLRQAHVFATGAPAG